MMKTRKCYQLHVLKENENVCLSLNRFGKYCKGIHAAKAIQNYGFLKKSQNFLDTFSQCNMVQA